MTPHRDETEAEIDQRKARERERKQIRIAALETRLDAWVRAGYPVRLIGRSPLFTRDPIRFADKYVYLDTGKPCRAHTAHVSGFSKFQFKPQTEKTS